MKSHLPQATLTEIGGPVVELAHTVALTFGPSDTLYITDRDAEQHPSGAVSLRGALAAVSGASQAWNFYTGLSAVGNVSAEIADPEPRELIPGGDFTAAGLWTYGGDWQHNATTGEADHAGAAGSDLTMANADLLVTPIIGRWYLVTYEVRNRTTGGVQIATNSLFENQATFRITNGRFAELVQCTNAALPFGFRSGSSFDGSLDNVSASELTVSRWLAYQLDYRGNGIRGQLLRHLVAPVGLPWAEFEVPAFSYFIDGAESEGAALTLRAGDAKRFLKQKIFAQDKTTLRARLNPGDTLVLLYGTDLAEFALVEHDATYSSFPSATVGYIGIGRGDAFEIIAYTGVIAEGGFRALQIAVGGRGLFGTLERVHDVDATITEPARQPAVTQYHYLQGPTVNLIHQLICGVSLVGGVADLPDALHCGVDPAYVDTASFTGIGDDLYNAAAPATVPQSLFERMTETNGKQLIERMLHRIGCRLRVLYDGRLSLRRVASVQAVDSYVYELNPGNVASHSAASYAPGEILTALAIDWNYDPLAERYKTRTAFVDGDAISAHGESDLRVVKHRGLRAGATTQVELSNYWRYHLERFASEPVRLSVRALPDALRVQEGDLVRVNLPAVRDMRRGTVGGFDRVCEVERVVEDWITGQVEIDLFGSTSKPDHAASAPAANVIPDATYDRTAAGGSALSSLVTIVSDVVTVGGNITGAADFADAQVFHLGNLQIDDAITWTGNLTLYVRGFVTIRAPLTSIGGGLAGGVPDATNPGASAAHYGPPGGSGLGAAVSSSAFLYGVSATGRRTGRTGRWLGNVTEPAVASMPGLRVSLDAAGELVGLPRDLRGSGGPAGSGTISAIVSPPSVVLTLGGAGGAGGGALLLICRGVLIDLAAGGRIDTSGADGSLADVYTDGAWSIRGGSGGGGSPGGLGLVLDGPQVPLDTTGFIANQGECPVAAGYTPLDQAYDNVGAPLPTGNWTTGDYDGLTSGGRGRWRADGDLAQNKRDARFAVTYAQGAEAAEDDASEVSVIATPAAPTLAVDVADAVLAPRSAVLNATVVVTWTASDDPNAAGYEVQARREANASWRTVAFAPGAAATSAPFPVAEGGRYRVRMRVLSRQRGGDSAFSAEAVTVVPFSAVGRYIELQTLSGAAASNYGAQIDVTTDQTLLAVGASQGGTAGEVFAIARRGTYATLATITPASGSPASFGASVAISDYPYRIAIGDSGDDTAATGAGRVEIYAFDGTAFVLEQAINGGGTNYSFGAALAISDAGDVLVVGAPTAEAATIDGRVYIYTRSGTTWSLAATFERDDNNPSANFGGEVQVSGDGLTVVAADPTADVGVLQAVGLATVYRDNGGGWAEVELLLPPLADRVFGMRFANQNEVAVSADGARILVGHSNGGLNNGAWLYQEGPTDTWSQVAAVSHSPGDGTGLAVALSPDGRRALVSEADYTGQQNGSGRVRTFAIDDDGAMTELATLHPVDEPALAAFGAPLELTAIGAVLGGNDRIWVFSLSNILP